MKSLNTDKESDQRLMNQIAEGKEAAFGQLFDKYWKPLAHAAYKVLKDREASHDIVQDIFIDFWSKRASLSVEHVSSYLHTAVRYRVINYIQKHKVPMQHLDFVDEFHAQHTTDELLNMREVNEILNEAINELPTQCKKVFKMSRFDNMSHKEIASQLNLSVRTVENHIAQAIRLLRPKMRDIMWMLWIICYL